MNKQTTTISITSGKGGVGKTTLVCNTALRLAQTGKRVLLIDGDFGLSNIDIFFSVRTKGTVKDVIYGDLELKDILIEVSQNVYLIPSGSGLVEYNYINNFERRAILESIRSLKMHFDYIITDTAPGISENVLYLNSASQHVCLVINPDPASFTDAYALIKVLNNKYKTSHFSIVCNQVADHKDGLSLFKRFSETVEKFLLVGFDYWGAIPYDQQLRKATQAQRLIVKQDPTSESTKAFRQICKNIEDIAHVPGLQQHGSVFWEQVVGFA